ncbi:MAG TPA: hypothetical protein DCM61_07520 [Clostridiales bacterium]|nr:hypothetical protein [Clostridiales bacterium]
MTFLHILGIILKILGFMLLGALGLVLVILLILLLIPIGADVEYIGGNFKLSAKVCGILIQLLPKKKKDEDKPPKEKKEKKKKEKKPKAEKETGAEKPKEKKKLDFTVEEIFEVIQKVLGSLKKFGKLTVDRFLLHYTAAGKDPYTTARTFGAVNASLCALEPVCSHQFRVKDYDVWTDCDFTADKMKIDIAVCITLRLWQFVHVGLAAAFGVLGVLIRHKRRIRKEKKAVKRLAASGGIKTEENIETIQGTEERNDKNG